MALLDSDRVANCVLIDQGGDHWTERIAEELGIAPAQAEQRKLSYAASHSGSPEDARVREILAASLEDWSRQLRQAYLNCIEQTSGKERAARCVLF